MCDLCERLEELFGEDAERAFPGDDNETAAQWAQTRIDRRAYVVVKRRELARRILELMEDEQQ